MGSRSLISSLSGAAAQKATRKSRIVENGVGPVPANQDAVDDDRIDTNGPGDQTIRPGGKIVDALRFARCDALGIEHDDIGRHPDRESSPVAQTEDLRRTSG